MVNIIGDSHTRSFGNLNGLNSYWLGPGRDINLQSDKIENIKVRLDKIEPNKSDINFLFFGEPNVRYQLGWDHHIFKKFKISEVNPIINKSYIDEVIENYYKLVDEIQFSVKILTPTTPYPPSIPAMIYFNEKLKETFGTLVVDIFKHTIDVNQKPKVEFRRDNFSHDPIHCNDKLVRLFEIETGLKFESLIKVGNNITQFGTISLR